MKIHRGFLTLFLSILLLMPANTGAETLKQPLPSKKIPSQVESPAVQIEAPAIQKGPAPAISPQKKEAISPLTVEKVQVKSLKEVKGGEEAVVILTGKNLDRVTKAEVQGATVQILKKTPTGLRLKLTGKGAALEQAAVKVTLRAGTEFKEVPLGKEIARARQVAAKPEIDTWREDIGKTGSLKETKGPEEARKIKEIEKPGQAEALVETGKIAEIDKNIKDRDFSTKIPDASQTIPSGSGTAPLPPPSSVDVSDVSKLPPGGGPSPAPGERGGPRGHVPTPEMIDEVRTARAICPDESSRPVIRFEANPPPLERLSTDRVTLTWEISKIHGEEWIQPVYLRTDVAREEVAARGSRVLEPPPVVRGQMYSLETQCGRASITVQWPSNPVIESVSPVTCTNTKTVGSTDSTHQCSNLNVRGHGFGSSSLGYRAVSARTGGGALAPYDDIVSWSNNLIVISIPDDTPAGVYTIQVTRGASRDHRETSAEIPAIIAWRTRIDMIIFEAIIRNLFEDASVHLHNLGEYTCSPTWAPNIVLREGGWRNPSGIPLSNEEVTELRAYCSSFTIDETPISDMCVQKRSCTRLAHESYLLLQDSEWILEIDAYRMFSPALGTVWYFMNDINSNLFTVDLRSSGTIVSTLEFEEEGREFRGFAPDEDGGTAWPDGHIDNMGLTTSLEHRIEDGNLTYIATETRFRGTIQARGICDSDIGPDICDGLYDYKNRISRNVESKFNEAFNSPRNQERLKEVIAEEMSKVGISRIGSISFDRTWMVIDEL